MYVCYVYFNKDQSINQSIHCIDFLLLVHTAIKDLDMDLDLELLDLDFDLDSE